MPIFVGATLIHSRIASFLTAFIVSVVVYIFKSFIVKARFGYFF